MLAAMLEPSKPSSRSLARTGMMKNTPMAIVRDTAIIPTIEPLPISSPSASAATLAE